jgi:hypothetical protein
VAQAVGNRLLTVSMAIMDGACAAAPAASVGLTSSSAGGTHASDQSALHRSWYDASGGSAAASGSSAAGTSADDLADAYFKGQNYFSQMQGAYHGESLKGLFLILKCSQMSKQLNVARLFFQPNRI